MPHGDVKAPRMITVNEQLSDRKENFENVSQLAQKLISSLDAQSNERMEHVSADDKLRDNNEG
jgi:hypothetical protein